MAADPGFFGTKTDTAKAAEAAEEARKKKQAERKAARAAKDPASVEEQRKARKARAEARKAQELIKNGTYSSNEQVVYKLSDGELRLQGFYNQTNDKMTVAISFGDEKGHITVPAEILESIAERLLGAARYKTLSPPERIDIDANYDD